MRKGYELWFREDIREILLINLLTNAGPCTAACYLHLIHLHFLFRKPSKTLQHAPFCYAELKCGSNYASSYIPEIFHFIPFYFKKKSFWKLCVTLLILMVLQNMLSHLLRTNFNTDAPITHDSAHVLLQHSAYLQTFSWNIPNLCGVLFTEIFIQNNWIL